MIRKILYSIIILAGVVFASYLLQPVKKGRGLDSVTHYELVTSWPQLPKDFLLGNPTGISIDTGGNIVVFHRVDRDWPFISPMPRHPIQGKTILILDKNSGKLKDSWGDKLFIMPHGLS